jgi:hypothetical protein
MHDTVTYCLERPLSVLLLDPSEKLVQKILICELGAVLTEVLLGNRVTSRYAHLQMWRGSNLFDLAAKELGEIHSRPAVPDGELDARGPGVEGQDIIGGDRRFALDHASIARTGCGVVRPAPILDFGHVFAVAVHINAMLD